MKDYHTHHPHSAGGFLNAVTREDWDRVAAAEGMQPCFGVHPWHARTADPAQIAFELDEYLTRYPQAGVGETGLDFSPAHRDDAEAQRTLLQVHLGAAFRHDRMAHLHCVRAHEELLRLLRERNRCGTLPRFLIHAWNGPHELAREFLALGGIFSVGKRELSHPRAAERYERIPVGKIFPETDDHPEDWKTVLAMFAVLRFQA